MALAQRLGGEHVLDLGGADAEGERTQGAMRRGMAVAANDRHARLREPLFRADDVDDALVDAIDREIGDAKIADILLERVDLQLGFRLVDAGLTIARRDVVVAHGHRRVGPAHLAAGEAQPLESLRRRHFMDQVQIDIDEVRALALWGDDMTVPDLVEQGTRLGHACCST